MTRVWLVVAIWLLASTALPAQTVRSSLEPRVAVGKNLAPAGMLLDRAAANQPWRYVEPAAQVFTRDRLLALPGTQADVEVAGGKVVLTLWGNVPQLSQFAGFQSEVVLHDTRSFDLDFTLAAGRVVLTAKKAGPVKVWARLPGLVEGRAVVPEFGACELTFAAEGDSVALEVHGRWPRGVPFSRLLRAGAAPNSLCAVTVLKGNVELKTGSVQHTLSAPPGPAVLTWDSESGPGTPQRLDKVPDWAAGTAPGVKVFAEVAKRYEAARAGRAPLEALLELISASAKDDDATRAVTSRQFAVVSLAAIDELARVGGAVELARWPEVRDVAIVALRHHIGEFPGRDVALFNLLVGSLNYPEAAADAVLQLLHSPFDPDQPETYAALLAYLRHPRPAVRELARWHLERYLPDGKKIAFDATADEAARDKAIAAWKKLIDERPGK